MPWLKAGTAGFIAALLMFGVMYVGIEVTQVAPFHVPPSAAFLMKTLGLEKGLAQIIGLVGHFGYGIFWSIVLLAIFWDRTSTGKGVGLSIALWLFMMLVLSPIIGWGFFGFGGTKADNPMLALGSSAKYVLITLVLHLLYGLVVGWMNGNWVEFGQDVAAEIRSAAKEDRIDTGT